MSSEGVSIMDKQIQYKYLVDTFGEDVIKERVKFFYALMNEYIDKEELCNKVIINSSLLKYAVLDYFADIDRLKQFHNITKTNLDKISAYSAYWLLRRKPLQLINEDDYDNPFVNEDFVASFVLVAARDGLPTVSLLETDLDTHNLFYRSLSYCFKYRAVDAQNIELMILAYRAGGSYQHSVDMCNHQII
jgi:hypothetical protein